MLKDNNKTLLVLVGILLVFTLAIIFYPRKNQVFTSETLLEMDKTKLLNYLEKEGLDLPNYYEEHRDVAEDFVYKFTRLFLEKKIELGVPLFDFEDSNDLLKNLGEILIKKGLL